MVGIFTKSFFMSKSVLGTCPGLGAWPKTGVIPPFFHPNETVHASPGGPGQGVHLQKKVKAGLKLAIFWQSHHLPKQVQGVRPPCKPPADWCNDQWAKVRRRAA